MNVENQLKTPLTQIRNLVKHVNKRNFNENSEQIKQLIQDYGVDADRSCLRYLFTVLNLNDPTPNVNAQLQAKLLGAHLQRQLQCSSFVTNICIAFDQHFAKQKSLKPIGLAELIGQVAKHTGINKLCECIFALAVTHSSHPELRQSARDSLRNSLPELLNSYLGQNAATAAAASGLHDISFDLLQYLLCCLGEYVTPQLEKQFLDKLREEFPRELVPLVLAPLLYRGATTTTAAKSSETDAEEETTNSNTSSWSSSNADNLNEVGIEDIYDHLCEIIFTNQVCA
ncbi:GH21958 [Drosophila grimshawi]|uniref:GH21958 n=1 Tax=Drosophila grimshawi TaxID=7222 RepID=B4J8T1_DROGR|nr:GH21958 [Drosophila grimshawi]